MAGIRNTVTLCPVGQAGFALVAVIWAIGIISLLFVTYIAAARYRAIEAFAISQRARAEAMANAEVNRVIFEIMSGLPKGAPHPARLGQVGLPVLCRVSDGSTISLSVSNESGKVDLNSATPELVEALIKSAVTDAGGARAIARRITEMRQSQDTSVTGTTPSDPAPRFRSVMELGQVAGVEQALVDSLSPLVTVHSGSPGVNPLVASDELISAISGGIRSNSRARAEASASAFLVAQAPGRTFLIETEASTPAGVRFSRNAVVAFTPGPPVSYSILEWREGLMRINPGPAGIATPPC